MSRPIDIDFGPAVEKMREREDARVQAEQRRIAEMPKRIAELERVARQAHEAMMDWHFVHGVPDDRMGDEERAMGAACRAIADVLDGGESCRTN